MSDDELRKLAVDYAEGHVYTNNEMPGRDTSLMVFMPLLLMEKESVQEFMKDCGMIYEYMNEAGPGALNGQPIFYSVRKLTNAETERFSEYVKAYQAMRRTFMENKA